MNRNGPHTYTWYPLVGWAQGQTPTRAERMAAEGLVIYERRSNQNVSKNCDSTTYHHNQSELLIIPRKHKFRRLMKFRKSKKEFHVNFDDLYDNPTPLSVRQRLLELQP